MNAQRLIGLMATLFLLSLLVGIASAATLDEIAARPEVKEHVEIMKRLEDASPDWTPIAQQIHRDLQDELYTWAWRSLDSNETKFLERISEQARRDFILGVLTHPPAKDSCTRHMLQLMFD